MQRMLRAVERGELRAALGAWGAELPESRLAEAAQTLLVAQRAGVALERRRGAWGELPSLEALIQQFVDSRDVTPMDPAQPDEQMGDLRKVGDELRVALDRAPGAGQAEKAGRRWLRQVASRLSTLEEDPALAVGVVQEVFERKLHKERHFQDDPQGWTLQGRLAWEEKDWNRKLVGPHRWLGARLVRLAPVALALFERVRAERQVIDFVEVLLRLRGLLRDRHEVRAELQGLFDHIFVDEFQDTDPLQCEIIFFLCEQGAKANRWEEVALAPGRLTVVGDPQQSIYRFRRADVAVYAAAVRHMQKDGALCERLCTNFRTRPELISWFNAALPKLLGRSDVGSSQAKEGRARYQPLEPSPKIAPFQPAQSVMLLHYAGRDQKRLTAQEGRPIEAQAIARLLQNLVRPGSKTRVRDEDTGEPRPLRPSDVAILAESTTHLSLLVEALTQVGLATTTRGGRMLMDHPTLRALLLGYCALCDADDGVAEAALLKPPFFHLDDDRAPDKHDPRWEEAQDLVRKLRRLRMHRAPGALMRDLIERSSLMHALVRERNGPQLLSACYDVALELEQRAQAQQLDAVAAAKLARQWANHPPPLVSPEPTGHEAVRAMTVYQAKGLEFPVVVLWDGFRQLESWRETDWHVSRDGGAWAMRLGDVLFEHPEGGGLLAEERRQRTRERERLAYVAATRARDLLILPLPRLSNSRHERNRLLAEAAVDHPSISTITYEEGKPPPWHRADDAPPLPQGEPDMGLDLDRAARALELSQLLENGVHQETTVQALSEAADEEVERAMPGSSWGTKPQEGQPGLDPIDEAIHAALRLAVARLGSPPSEAVDRVVRSRGLQSHRVEVSENVSRILAALQERALLARGPQGWIRAAVPLLVPREGEERLLKASIDLLAQQGDDLFLIEVKTEKPPPSAGALASTSPHVLVELRLLAEGLTATGLVPAGHKVRRVVVFSRSGLWVEVAHGFTQP
jgi:ATP-dependent helicase/nuclease subunit A